MTPAATKDDDEDAKVKKAGLKAREAAEYIGVSVRSFYRLVQVDRGIRRARRCPTARPVYVRTLLKEWLESKRGAGCPTTDRPLDVARRAS